MRATAGVALHNLGLLAEEAATSLRRRTRSEHALDIARRYGDAEDETLTLISLGFLRIVRDKRPWRRSAPKPAWAAQRLGFPVLEAQAIHNLGFFAWAAGDLALAQRRL